MKRSAFILITIIGFCFNCLAQQGIKGMAYSGVGLMIPTGYMQHNSLLKEGVNFRAGYFHSFSPATKRVGIGVELRLDYSKLPADIPYYNYSPTYLYDNGSGQGAQLYMRVKTEKKKPDVFQYLVGPSVLLVSGKWLVQPSLLFGYASVSQEKFSFYDSLIHTTDASQNRNVVFYYGEHETNNGFVLVPSLKSGYRITPKLAALFCLDFSMGSSQVFGDFVLMPSGTPVNNAYKISDIANGTYKPVPRESKFQAFTLSLSIAYTFSVKK